MNKRNIALLVGASLVSLASLALSSAALAEDNAPQSAPGSARTPIAPPPQGLSREIRDIQGQKREAITSMRASTTAAIQGIRKDARGQIQNEREDMRELMKSTTSADARMGLRDKIDAMRGDIKDTRKAAFASTTDLRLKMRAEIEDRRDEAKDDIMNAVRERNMRLASTTERMMRMGSTSPRMGRMGSSTDAERTARAVEQAAKFAKQALDRMGAAIDRFNGLVVRIQSRIDKVSAAGGDTTAAKVALADAQSKITTAKDGITTVSGAFAEVATLTNPKDGAAKVETAMKNQQVLMKAAQDALAKAASALTGQKGADTPASTVSNDNTATTPQP
jgi:hypothetical protein